MNYIQKIQTVVQLQSSDLFESVLSKIYNEMLTLWGILHPLIISLTVIPLPVYEHKKK